MTLTRPPRTLGFTLIEMMVTVAIIGLLGAVAIPGYRAYVAKGNRAAVQTHMLNWATAQSSYLADARTYATKAQLETVSPTPSNVSAKYTLDVALEDGPPRFTITAKPIPGTSQAGDPELSIDSSGLKKPAGKW